MNIIKEIRKDKDLSQTEFATICDVSVQTVFDLEHGQRATINESILNTLDRLGYNPEEVAESYDYQRQTNREEMLQQLA